MNDTFTGIGEIIQTRTAALDAQYGAIFAKIDEVESLSLLGADAKFARLSIKPNRRTDEKHAQVMAELEVWYDKINKKIVKKFGEHREKVASRKLKHETRISTMYDELVKRSNREMASNEKKSWNDAYTSFVSQASSIGGN
jgi:hypothetical protein